MSRVRVRVRSGDPDHGPLCACGNAKSPQARCCLACVPRSTTATCQCGGRKARQAKTCQRCHSELRGYGRGIRARSLLAQTQPPLVKRETLEHKRETLIEAGGELAALVFAQKRDDNPYIRIGRFFPYNDGEDHSNHLVI